MGNQAKKHLEGVAGVENHWESLQQNPVKPVRKNYWEKLVQVVVENYWENPVKLDEKNPGKVVVENSVKIVVGDSVKIVVENCWELLEWELLGKPVQKKNP